ncbi:MAG TPA: hypothetical protein VK348_06410 [Planctomycetota bacterium]|nr:hypothetical protein [Planctomycetota bacterium]
MPQYAGASAPGRRRTNWSSLAPNSPRTNAGTANASTPITPAPTNQPSTCARLPSSYQKWPGASRKPHIMQPNTSNK